jgi:hypothetical protein
MEAPLEKEELEWIPVKTTKTNPEAVYKCDKCPKSTLTHPNYHKAGIIACVLGKKCYKLEEVVQKMLKCRNWTYKSIHKVGKNPTITFTCENGHDNTLTYESLRKGSGCKTCTVNKRIKPKVETEKIERTNCGCKGNEFDGSTVVCPHYNHKIDPAGGADEWSYELNPGIIPETVAPSSAVKYWYKCKNNWCNMSYQQMPNSRRHGARCGYCSGKKVCGWNSLQTNYPEVCKELDPENASRATEVTSKSGLTLNWICYKHGEPPFIYPMKVINKVEGAGCPACNVVGYKQRHGGHEVFLEDVRRVHGDKYEYHHPYQGAHTLINIYCPAVSKSTGDVHGYFMQTPDNHKSGQNCPKCARESTESKLVKDIKEVLTELGFKLDVDYFMERSLTGLVSLKENPLYLDFCIPGYNLIIEADGQQHFEGFKYANGEGKYEEGRVRDLIKDKYCIEKGVNLLRIPYSKKIDLIRVIIVETLKKIITGERIIFTYKEFYEENKALIDQSGVKYLEMGV